MKGAGKPLRAKAWDTMHSSFVLLTAEEVSAWACVWRVRTTAICELRDDEHKSKVLLPFTYGRILVLGRLVGHKWRHLSSALLT